MKSDKAEQEGKHTKLEHYGLQMPMLSPMEQLLQGENLDEIEPYPDLYYWLWLADVLAPANGNAGKVMDSYGDAVMAYDVRLTEQFAAVVGKAVAQRVQGYCLAPEACAKRVALCEKYGVRIITFADPEYPLSLVRIPDPPLVLYATGNLSALDNLAMVGMVGTRRPTAYGASVAAQFGKEFAHNGMVIVSGLADGLDAESHRAALDANAPTIAVMGTPIHKTFPSANVKLRKEIEKTGGLVLSEYPPDYGTNNYKVTFLQRNRIIAALSDALVVLEARAKSGTMSTVSHAERYEKPIFAVPGSVFSNLSEGTNLLLHEGRAQILLGGKDVLSELGLHETAKQEISTPKTLLSANAKKVLACIGATPTGVGAIASQSGLAMGAILSTLSTLEMEGYIITLPGRQYTIK